VTSIRAARRTDGTVEVFAFFCVVGLACTLPGAVYAWRAPTPGQWVLVGVIGAMAAVAQLLMTHALRVVEGAVTGIINELAVVIAILLGSTLDHEPLPGLSAIGAAITLVGVAWAAQISARMETPPPRDRSGPSG